MTSSIHDWCIFYRPKHLFVGNCKNENDVTTRGLGCESFKFKVQLEREGLGNMFKIQKYQPAKPKLIKIGHLSMRRNNVWGSL